MTPRRLVKDFRGGDTYEQGRKEPGIYYSFSGRYCVVVPALAWFEGDGCSETPGGISTLSETPAGEGVCGYPPCHQNSRDMQPSPARQAPATPSQPKGGGKGGSRYKQAEDLQTTVLLLQRGPAFGPADS